MEHIMLEGVRGALRGSVTPSSWSASVLAVGESRRRVAPWAGRVRGNHCGDRGRKGALGGRPPGCQPQSGVPYGVRTGEGGKHGERWTGALKMLAQVASTSPS